jgi:hypothetical protein
VAFSFVGWLLLAGQKKHRTRYGVFLSYENKLSYQSGPRLHNVLNVARQLGTSPDNMPKDSILFFI